MKRNSKMLSPQILRVGVFVNEDIEVIANLLKDQVIDIVQLHGAEDEKYISLLRKRMKRGKIIKAIRVASQESIQNCEQWDADYLLFDTFSKTEFGGTGEVFDWSMIQNIQKPFFLAGGINSENVEEAIKKLHPYGVDVSSAVETKGWKDKEKIADMVSKVRLISQSCQTMQQC